MNGMMEAFKALAPNKDFASFQVGYYCRQEHIEILQEENIELRTNKLFYEKKKMVIESLERLFTNFLAHENSECSNCIICEKQWLTIEMIQEKLEDLKS